MLCQLAGEDEADSSLDLPGGDSWLLVVTGQRCGLHGDLFKDVSDERVQDGHGLGGDAGVGVDLLQDLQRAKGLSGTAVSYEGAIICTEEWQKCFVPCRCRSCSSPPLS